MKIVLLLIIAVLWFILPTLAIIAAVAQSIAKDQRRNARRLTWEGMTLTRVALKNYDKLSALFGWHQYLRAKINALIEKLERPNIVSFIAEWRQIRLHRLFRQAKENARRYNRLGRQTGFQFQQRGWVPDGEPVLPRQLSILEPAWKLR